MMGMNGTVPTRTLVIAAHMDDEVLGAGGLIRKRICCGEKVEVLTCFGRKYEDRTSKEARASQGACFAAAREVLGYDKAYHLWKEEGEPAKVGYYSLLKPIEERLRKFKPTEVVIPGRGDLNQDHRHLNEVCRIALRAANRHQGMQYGPIERVLEMIGHDTFAGPQEATYGVVLTAQMVDKVEQAMRCYVDEMRPPPHPRSLASMDARYCFYGAQFGFDYVEPFRLLFGID